MQLSLLLLSILLPSTLAASQDRFTETCDRTILVRNYDFWGSCLESEGKEFQTSYLDLRRCIVNDNGVLRPLVETPRVT
ncbi:hypothetical protein N7492_006577 [Penicillium capsulatum]|uniref:Cyanovirin-N domain-containing protein n=1 Tax=Penicillium capsulatum TaxID=69766 RepID=A0A9W9I354_9EURO|nr:hypothetical protein N7492_006577 [Penicillium capsulatum]KAJ6116412.1 hypothetical protein N7512_006137 [Penicillium capsulatum]